MGVYLGGQLIADVQSIRYLGSAEAIRYLLLIIHLNLTIIGPIVKPPMFRLRCPLPIIHINNFGYAGKRVAASNQTNLSSNSQLMQSNQADETERDRSMKFKKLRMP